MVNAPNLNINCFLQALFYFTINNINGSDIPIWRKYTLSVQEASKYFHIGDKKLRKLIEEDPTAEFILWNGTRPQIKRKVFERFIDEKLSAI